MSENTDRILAELSAAKFAPPEISYAKRQAEIYRKFENFAKITSQYIDDPRILAEFAAIRRKLGQ